MTDPTALNDLEQLLMLAVARLEGSAYGVTIRSEILDRAGRRVSMAAVYAALDRLEARRLVRHRLSPPTPERGGRRRKLYRVTETGADALTEARNSMARMWDGVDLDTRRSA
jgi:DNA-binding PadR family transcriptional regulator